MVSTRVKAPATTNQLSLPIGLQNVVLNDAANPNLIGRLDDSPRAGPACNTKPNPNYIEGLMLINQGLERHFLTMKKTIGIGTWNVRTLHQIGNFDIQLHQMQSYDLDILGVSETHWTDAGEFSAEGFKILCSGYETVHRAGVAPKLNKVAQNAPLGYNPISPRMISTRFQTQGGAITIIQIYVPNTTDKEMVDKFSDQLQTTPHQTMACSFMGDFNAKVGDDTTEWKDVMGRNGYEKSNARGEKLLKFCVVND